MEFRKMVTITLYTRQQKRHWCIEQSYRLCGRGRGWDDLGEWHWNLYTIMYETSRQSRFDAQYWMLGAGALGRPKGMLRRGRREEGSGWGTHVYLWRIHFDIWQNQYNIVKFKNKIKLKKKSLLFCCSVSKSCLTLWDPTYHSMPGSSVFHCLPEFAPILVHWVSDGSHLILCWPLLLLLLLLLSLNRKLYE